MYILLDDKNYIRAISDTKLKDSVEIKLPKDFQYGYQNCYRLEDKTLVYDSEKEIEYRKSELRSIRSDILNGFDIYKINVYYGIEQDNNREQILIWYQDLLDLKENAFENIPEQVKKYM